MRYLSGALIVVLAMGLVVPIAMAQDYMGNAKCKMCHNQAAGGEQWNKWNEGPHKKAFEVLKSEKAVEVGKAQGLEKPPHESPECLQCHVTGYDVEAKAIAAGLKMEDGVQCESCHGAVGSEHQKWGMAARMGRAEEGADKGVTKGTKEDCLKCHNDKNPTWDPEKYEDADGNKVGFDFEKAYAKINHNKPEE